MRSRARLPPHDGSYCVPQGPPTGDLHLRESDRDGAPTLAVSHRWSRRSQAQRPNPRSSPPSRLTIGVERGLLLDRANHELSGQVAEIDHHRFRTRVVGGGRICKASLRIRGGRIPDLFQRPVDGAARSRTSAPRQRGRRSLSLRHVRRSQGLCPPPVPRRSVSNIRVSVDIEESGVRCQVNLASFIPLRSDQTHKPLIRLQSHDLHSDTGQCPFDGGSKPVDTLNGETEEVEISGSSINIASDDERATPGQGKVFCFVESGDDRRDPFLKRGQHSRSIFR